MAPPFASTGESSVPFSSPPLPLYDLTTDCTDAAQGLAGGFWQPATNGCARLPFTSLLTSVQSVKSVVSLSRAC
jgi:hypothetical protein